MAREILAEDPTPIGYELWDGQRKVSEHRKRDGLGRAPEAHKRRRT